MIFFNHMLQHSATAPASSDTDSDVINRSQLADADRALPTSATVENERCHKSEELREYNRLMADRILNADAV